MRSQTVRSIQKETNRPPAAPIPPYGQLYNVRSMAKNTRQTNPASRRPRRGDGPLVCLAPADGAAHTRYSVLLATSGHLHTARSICQLSVRVLSLFLLLLTLLSCSTQDTYTVPPAPMEAGHGASAGGTSSFCACRDRRTFLRPLVPLLSFFCFLAGVGFELFLFFCFR